MKQKFRLYRRGASGRYYAQDNITGQQQRLGTTNRIEALRLLCAQNEADYQPAFNGHVARTYLSAGDPEIAKRNWQWVVDALLKSKTAWSPSTQDRYSSSMSEKALARRVIEQLPHGDPRLSRIAQRLRPGNEVECLVIKAHLPWRASLLALP